MKPDLPELGIDVEAEANPSLEAELLEASEAVAQKAIAAFQVEQNKRLLDTERLTMQWGQEQLAGGTNGHYVHFLVAEHLRKTRAALHNETLDFAYEERLKQATRDNAIALFCSKQHQ